MKKELSEYARSIVRTSRVCILTNSGLSLLKILVGFLGNSHALIADGVDSAADVLSGFIVMLGAKVSGRASDTEHPYGHERFECVASLILANVLLLCGIGIGFTAVSSIVSGAYRADAAPTLLALIAAAISITAKGGLWLFTRRAANRLNSGSLKADSQNYRNDMFASLGTLIGVTGAQLGLPILDPIMGLVITALIFRTAIGIYKESIDQMVDKACDRSTEQQMRATIASCDGVQSIDLLKTRQFENKIYADVEITADGTMTLEAAHAIAQDVHDRLEKTYPTLKHCMIHVNPTSD